MAWKRNNQVRPPPLESTTTAIGFKRKEFDLTSAKESNKVTENHHSEGVIVIDPLAWWLDHLTVSISGLGLTSG